MSLSERHMRIKQNLSHSVKISGAKSPERVRHLVYHEHSIPRTEIDRILVSLNMGQRSSCDSRGLLNLVCLVLLFSL